MQITLEDQFELGLNHCDFISRARMDGIHSRHGPLVAFFSALLLTVEQLLQAFSMTSTWVVLKRSAASRARLQTRCFLILSAMDKQYDLIQRGYASWWTTPAST